MTAMLKPTQLQTHITSQKAIKKKIFGDDEGEYVDFEEQ